MEAYHFLLIAVIVLFLTYYFSTMRVPEHLSNFGVYIPILLFWVSIHGIIPKEQNSLPLSAVFSNRQLTLLIFSGVIIFSLIAIILNGGYSLLLLCWMPCLRFYMFAILLWISISRKDIIR